MQRTEDRPKMRAAHWNIVCQKGKRDYETDAGIYGVHGEIELLVLQYRL